METCFRTPEEHIDWIRRNKFGLAPDGSVIGRNPLSEDLQNSIRLLSGDLYSKETHFILELIQNAEDNHYRQDLRPDLTYLLLEEDPTGTPGAEGALLGVNNEKGFTAEDVDALCAVGKPTKKKREGYIGEKGIGFKSVFVVSSRPHIFSAGYRFRFQEEPDPAAQLGYIVPCWVLNEIEGLDAFAGRTCILLPLKAGKWQQVARELESIAPETILFLSKLEGLTVQVGQSKPVKVVRDESRKPLVQFMKGDQCADFWVVHKDLPVPDTMHEDKREGVDARRVSVALPLSDEFELDKEVFAFLPTEAHSGFPFLINADFILSTSREAIQIDRPWNEWLRDSLPPVFAAAFTSLLEKGEHRASAYSFIPLTDEDRSEFFEPVVETIHAALRQRQVVWVTDGDRFVKPSEARMTGKDFRSLLCSGTQPKLLEVTALVHPVIQPYRKQLKAIGVEELSPDEIVLCLQDDAWLDSQTTGWWVKLYEYLRKQAWARPDRLQGLPLLPMEGNGRAVVGQPVYLPGEVTEQIARAPKCAASVLPISFLSTGLYEELRREDELEEEQLDYFERMLQGILGKRGRLDWLRAAVGVKDLTLANYCVDLARSLGARRSELAADTVVELTRFIRDHIDELDDDTRKAIAEHLPVVLADGRIVAPNREWHRRRRWREEGQPEALVVPEACDPAAGWQFVFSDPEDRGHMAVLSDAYAVDSSAGEIESWQALFEVLGATPAPSPRYQVWQWWHRIPEDIRTEAARFLKAEHERSTRHEEFGEWRAPRWLREVGIRVGGNSAIDRRSRALLRWLEARLPLPTRWPERFDTAWYHWHYRDWKDKKTVSEFAIYLRDAPWFPSTHGLKRPSEVFLDKPELRELFGDALPYALGKPSEKVANWVGLRQKATVDELLQYLKELTSRPADRVDQKVVRKIYTFLSERWRSEIKDQFEEYPLILVSKPQPRWVTAEQTVWLDSSAVVGEAYVYLEAQYPRRFKEFFVEKVGVAEQLDDDRYARAWAHFAHRDDFEAEAVEAALERIYPVLLKVAQKENPPGWWQEFCADAEVWTQSDCFEAAKQVYVPDDGELKRLFTREGVEFAWRPEKASFAEYQPLYSALGVRSLVEMVETSAEVQQVIESDGRQPLLTSDAKKAVCFYLRNTNRDEYERTKQSGVLEALLRTREQTVRSLTVSYELNRRTTVQIPDSSAHWQEDEHVLYRSDVHSQDQLEIEMAAILARRVAGGRTSNALENFIGCIIGASAAKVEGIIHKKNWNLPAEEQEWIDEVLASSLRQAEPEPKPKSEPKTEPEPEPESETEAASPKSKHELGGRPEPRPAPKPAPQPRPRPEPKPEPGLKPGPKPEPRRRRPRLRSYVEPGRGGAGVRPLGEGESQEEREAIERAGIEFALEYERQHERIPEELPPNHEGWDIDSYAEDLVAAILDKDQKHRLTRRIEVKATKYGWDGWGIGLTAPEYRAAQCHGEQYYLYVIEHALDENLRRLFVFHNPVDKIDDYRLDDRWKAAADEEYKPEALDI